MGWFDSTWFGTGGSGSSGPTFPVIANAATAESIRDRIYALIEAITPTYLSGDKFRRYRNELGADFDGWADKNQTGALRRFQVRQVGDDTAPETSNVSEETVRVEFEIRIAYPQTHRYGGANAMDRDDVMNEDWKLINGINGVTMYGRGNFTGSYDCTPLPATKSREQTEKNDMLVVRCTYIYVRQTT
jgi:hypothetical protein